MYIVHTVKPAARFRNPFPGLRLEEDRHVNLQDAYLVYTRRILLFPHALRLAAASSTLRSEFIATCKSNVGG